MKEIELDHDDELSFLLGNKSSLVDLTDPPGVAHRRGRNSFSFPVDSLTDIVCLSKRSLFVTGMYSLDSYHVRFPCFFFFLPSLFFCTSFLFCPFSLSVSHWLDPVLCGSIRSGPFEFRDADTFATRFLLLLYLTSKSVFLYPQRMLTMCLMCLCRVPVVSFLVASAAQTALVGVAPLRGCIGWYDLGPAIFFSPHLGVSPCRYIMSCSQQTGRRWNERTTCATRSIRRASTEGRPCPSRTCPTWPTSSSSNRSNTYNNKEDSATFVADET